PNEKEFHAMCPSIFETVCQVTVYEPFGRDGSASFSSNGRPGTPSVGALCTCCPVESSTWRRDSSGSGGSVNVATICVGAFWSVAPFAGTEDFSKACASAAPAKRTIHARAIVPMSTKVAMRFISSVLDERRVGDDRRVERPVVRRDELRGQGVFPRRQRGEVDRLEHSVCHRDQPPVHREVDVPGVGLEVRGRRLHDRSSG